MLNTIFVLCLICFALPPRAQAIVRSFDAAKGLDLETCNLETMRCKRQPEMDAAVNGKQVLQVTRQDVNRYDYGGKRLRSTPMS